MACGVEILEVHGATLDRVPDDGLLFIFVQGANPTIPYLFIHIYTVYWGIAVLGENILFYSNNVNDSVNYR